MELYYGAPDDRQLERVREINCYAFAAHRPPGEAIVNDTLDGMGVRRILARGDEVLASCQILDLPLQVRGHPVTSAGVSAVASPPQHRRRGHVRRLLASSTAESAGQGCGLSLLWAFSTAFYGRLGWATCGDYLRFSFPPSVLEVFRADPGGRYVFIGPDDFHLIDGVYREWCRSQALVLDRWPQWWQKAVFRNWETQFRVAAWEKDGRVRAYMLYVIDGNPDGRRFYVRSVRAVDPQGWEAMWHLCYNHQAQVSVVRYAGPVDDPLQLAVPEWGQGGKVELHKGPMVRCANPQTVLDGFPIPDGVRGEINLDVLDPMPGATAARVGVRFDSGRARVSPGTPGPRVTLGTGTLGQVVTGYAGPRRLAGLGWIDASDEALALLDAAFPPLNPLLWEAF